MTQSTSASASGQPYVLPLDAVTRQKLAEVGGKAANLGELIAAKLPVPPGFCITTRAYAAAAAGAELDETLDSIAGMAAAVGAPFTQPTAESGAPHALAALGAAAREALVRTPIPPDVESAIREAYAALSATTGQPDVPVAVRSSATAEDLPGASFAGQQDTFLNVVGADAVVEAARRCWASLWTDRAVVYRARNGIDPHGVQLAVVVQQQIQSAVAGVMFTANPITGRRGQAVIDASPGLGEAVVSGAVTPDHFVVDTASGQVLERHLGDKRLRIESLPGGGTRRIDLAAEPEAARTACVTDVRLRELAGLARRVEHYYGAPQDTEWAIDADGVLWLLQSRPITTLYPLPESATNTAGGESNAFKGDTLRVYFSFNVAQGVYQPITPMGIQAFKLFGSAVAQMWGLTIPDPAAGPPFIVEAGHRIFLDITTPLRHPIGRVLVRQLITQGEARSAPLLDSVLQDPRLGRAERTPFRRRAPRRRSGSAHRHRAGSRTGAGYPDRARRRSLNHLGAFMRRRAELPEDATANQRLDRVTALPAEIAPELLASLVPLLVAGIGSYAIAQRLLRGIATPDELNAVRRGLPHNPTTEMDLALWSLAQRVRSDPAAAQALIERTPDDLAHDYVDERLPLALQRGLGEFIAAYGHRGVAEIDLGLARWGDDPTHILGVLANYLAHSEIDVAPDAQFRRVAAEADAMVTELAERAARRGRWRGRAVRFLLGRFRELGGLREAPKFYLVKLLYTIRQWLAPVGQELVGSGRLERPDDVYLLTLPELRAAVAGTDVRPIVSRRREELAFEAQRRRVPRLLLSDGSVPEAAVGRIGSGTTDARSDALQGVGASSGTVTGVARVILDPHAARLEPGEILVAPSTDPGWTPLFLTAGGLVMEMGGPMSHGAIVTHEYGIPAVVGVPDATELIRTGQTITIDGSAGTVSLSPSTDQRD